MIRAQQASFSAFSGDKRVLNQIVYVKSDYSVLQRWEESTGVLTCRERPIVSCSWWQWLWSHSWCPCWFWLSSVGISPDSNCPPVPLQSQCSALFLSSSSGRLQHSKSEMRSEAPVDSLRASFRFKDTVKGNLTLSLWRLNHLWPGVDQSRGEGW